MYRLNVSTPTPPGNILDPNSLENRQHKASHIPMRDTYLKHIFLIVQSRYHKFMDYCTNHEGTTVISDQ